MVDKYSCPRVQWCTCTLIVLYYSTTTVVVLWSCSGIFIYIFSAQRTDQHYAANNSGQKDRQTEGRRTTVRRRLRQPLPSRLSSILIITLNAIYKHRKTHRQTKKTEKMKKATILTNPYHVVYEHLEIIYCRPKLHCVPQDLPAFNRLYFC